ncbi:MAG TPA: DUF4197 domain-containing protein [Rhodocyclaceae bacterium]
MFARLFAFLLALFFAGAAQALSFDSLSNKDAGGGLKEALSQGASLAVDQLGKTDGFMGNPKVRIPLPENLEKAEGLLRTMGAGKYVDELEVAMNRAAEAAVPEAKALLLKSIKSMSLQDAKGILGGGDDAATQYFRRTTSAPLGEKFKPIVQKAIAKVQLAEKYDQFAGRAAKLGLVKEGDAHLDNYITQKALDGLYLMIAEQEKAIRKDPLSATGSLAKKVFGLLR